MKVLTALSALFMLGGSIGWVLELCYRRLAHGKWINPGFLTGPCLPLYGTGVLLLYGFCSLDLSFIASSVLREIVRILLLAVVLIKIFLVPGLPCGHTLYAAGTGAFLLCTGLELPQTLFEAARGMLTLPDLLTGIGIGLFGLCGLVCAWEACGKETE